MIVSLFLISFIIIFIFGIWTYFVQKQVSYRFFYPAIVLFILFTLVPIIYGVYVSLTNLKTGNLLSQKEVTEILLSDVSLVEGSQLIPAKYYKKGNEYFIATQFTPPPPDQAVELSPPEVFDHLESLQKLRVTAPDGKVYSFFRSDLIAETFNLFQLADGKIIESLSKKELIEDTKNGRFLLDGHQIGPGYFIFQGLKNYINLIQDPSLKKVFTQSIVWTFTWAFGSVLLTFSLGTILAVLLNESKETTRLFYRIIYIIPYSIPFFISVLVFKGLLNKDFGAVNAFLSFFKISPVPWLDHKLWAKVSVLLVNLWLGFPYMFLVVTGILQSIPKSIYEAAQLDGASRLQTFRFLTFPLVITAMVPLLIGSFAFNLNNFVGIYLLTGGGPVIADVQLPIGETDILISYTYRLAFEGSMGQNFSLAASVSVLIFLMMAAITFINFKISNQKNKFGAKNG